MLTPSVRHLRARLTRILALLAVSAHLLVGCSVAGARERFIASGDPPASIVLRWGPAECAPEKDAGRRAVRCRTQGSGEPIFAASARSFAEPLDLTRQFVKVWIKVADVSRLAGLELRLSSDDFQSGFYAIPVPLYADPEFNVLQNGVWTPYTLSFAAARVHGTPDRERIDSIGWYVRDAGQGPLEIAWAGLAAVEVSGPGVVSLTFDDGTIDHLTLCAAELARAGYRGTAYVIPDMVGRPGFLSLADIETLRDRYGWEIAAHHTTPLTEMPAERLEPVLSDITRWLSEHGFGAHAGHFAFPLGKTRPGPVMQSARRHFTTARVAGSGPETLPPADPHALRVYNVVRTTEPQAVLDAARRAVENGDWLILMLHRVREPQQSDLDYSPAKLREIVRLLDASEVPVAPLGEVWETRVAAPDAGHDTPASGR